MGLDSLLRQVMVCLIEKQKESSIQCACISSFDLPCHDSATLHLASEISSVRECWYFFLKSWKIYDNKSTISKTVVAVASRATKPVTSKRKSWVAASEAISTFNAEQRLLYNTALQSFKKMREYLQKPDLIKWDILSKDDESHISFSSTSGHLTLFELGAVVRAWFKLDPHPSPNFSKSLKLFSFFIKSHASDILETSHQNEARHLVEGMIGLLVKHEDLPLLKYFVTRQQDLLKLMTPRFIQVLVAQHKISPAIEEVLKLVS
jgi:hypothetical protein